MSEPKAKAEKYDRDIVIIVVQLESVYSEIFRVLKPGGKFVTYEWLKTSKFDGSNEEHVKIIDDICHGNSIPVSLQLNFVL